MLEAGLAVADERADGQQWKLDESAAVVQPQVVAEQLLAGSELGRVHVIDGAFCMIFVRVTKVFVGTCGCMFQLEGVLMLVERYG